jgi:integrase
MFKSSKDMAKIKFLLQSKSENSQIYIRVSISQFVSIKKKTGFSINPKDWSLITDRPKQNNPENKITHSSLNKLEDFVFDNLNKDLANSTLIDSFWLENKIKECFNRVEKNNSGLLLNHVQYIIDNANTRKITGTNKLGLSKNRIVGYTTFKNLFTLYQTEIKKQINFLDVSKTFVDKFINWLVNEKKYSMNYAGKQIDNLKTVCLDAEKNEIPTNIYIRQIQGFSENDEDRYIQTLSFEELELIRSVELPNEKLNNARNWILLGCEIGQRGGDLMKITTEDIRYKGKSIYLDVVQQKTKKSVTVGVIAPHVIDIIENNLPKKISSQKLNDYIKEVCELAGIDTIVEGKKFNAISKRKELGMFPKHQLITSHSFRRSFATNYYKKIPTPILINITGHSKESLFLTYINKREDKDANADLFMQFYEKINKEKTPQLKILRTAN